MNTPNTPHFKRAQAAFEFLTTYAWAFIAILIIIGALSYFGITNPSKLLPDRCTGTSEFTCQAQFIDSRSSTANIKMANNLGAVINVSNFALYSESRTPFCYLANQSGFILSSGRSLDITFNNGTQPPVAGNPCNFLANGYVGGEKARIYVGFDFYELKNGVKYTRPVEIEIYTRVY